MAEDTFKKFALGSIFVMLFALAAFTVVIRMGVANDKDVTSFDGGEGEYDLNAVNTSLSEIYGKVNQIGLAFNKSASDDKNFFEKALETGASIVYGAGAMLTTPFAIIGFTWTAFEVLLIQSFSIVFGNPIITYTIAGIVLLAILFGLYRLWRQGS